MRIRSIKAFTLLELLIAAYILLVGICGVFLLYARTMHSSETSWDTSVAVLHAQSILEEMQRKNTLVDIKTMNWVEWINAENIRSLPKENITVSIDEAHINPLDIGVDVQWERAGQMNTIHLQTAISR